MRILGFKGRRPSRREIQKQMQAEIKAWEDEMRKAKIPFSIPLSGEDSKGKYYKGD